MPTFSNNTLAEKENNRLLALVRPKPDRQDGFTEMPFEIFSEILSQLTNKEKAAFTSTCSAIYNLRKQAIIHEFKLTMEYKIFSIAKIINEPDFSKSCYTEMTKILN